MVKQTFLNLSAEKRQRIVDVALEEFATHRYGKASLSKIVSLAGIAKGSIYQYFEDKRALFVYLLELAVQEKLAYINQEVDPAADFFASMEQAVRASVRFSLNHPRLSQLIANAMEPSGEEALLEISSKGKEMSLDFFTQFLLKGQKEGSIRIDIDTRFTATMIYAMMGTGLVEYILSDLGISTKQFISDSKMANSIIEKKLDHIINEMMKFFRIGLGMKG